MDMFVVIKHALQMSRHIIEQKSVKVQPSVGVALWDLKVFKKVVFVKLYRIVTKKNI